MAAAEEDAEEDEEGDEDDEEDEDAEEEEEDAEADEEDAEEKPAAEAKPAETAPAEVEKPAAEAKPIEIAPAEVAEPAAEAKPTEESPLAEPEKPDEDMAAEEEDEDAEEDEEDAEEDDAEEESESAVFSATIGNILFSAVAANAALLAATELAVTTFVANLAGLPVEQVGVTLSAGSLKIRAELPGSALKAAEASDSMGGDLFEAVGKVEGLAAAKEDPSLPFTVEAIALEPAEDDEDEGE